MRLVIAASSELDFATLQLWQLLLPQVFERVPDLCGRRWTTWQKGIDADHRMQGFDAV
jgi:hypothetical protein